MFRKIVKNTVDSLIRFECLFIQTEKHTKKRVLILRKDTLGDYIIFYPTLTSYRQAYRDSEITLVLSSLFQSLSPLLSDFEHIIWFDAKRYSNDLIYRRSFLKNLRRSGFDTAIYTAFSREPAGDLMIQITDAPIKIAVDGDLTAITESEKERGNTQYSKLVTVPDSLITELSKNIYIAEAITGKMSEVDFPTIDINIFPDIEAENILEQNDLISQKFVIFFPGSGTTFKIWPTEKFAEIADYFISKDVIPVFCGSKGERPLIASIINQMKSIANPRAFVNLAGETDLPTIGHLLKHSQFYFGSDTGILHLAAAISVPSICILGGGHFFRFFPYGDLEKNRIIFDADMSCKNDNWKCAHDLPPGESAPCVKNIKVEDAKREIDILLNIYSQ